MRATTLVGVILLALGLIGLIAGGLNYRSHDKVIDAGPIQVSGDTTHRVPIHPAIGGVLIAAGVVLLFVGKGRN